ncbi:tyrosine-type recombinase/integrase [Planomonospora sp. ID91781]|uniref:tyrosine-type recombinase/integrase n=1 Tax=Planomonospora sp. ID91781 TaxID=2738135 RepID=UPI0018C3B0C8|nr:tyrosine-type recombinase/integrase [Planomonospora sp. ID91781]MBG0825914.1 tyrosine-type recombinase/integrase [Planomonospora sp. ID91781]
MRSQEDDRNALIASSDDGRSGSLATPEDLEAVRAYLARALEDNTRRAYADDLRAWIRFCDARHYDRYPLTPVSVVRYVEHLAATGKAYKTIERRVTGLRGALKAAGHPVDEAVAAAARTALSVARKDIMREPGRRGRGKATAFTIAELRAMSAACPATLAGARDRALVLLGFAIAARRSELAALHLGDVRQVPEGLEVHVRWSKTGTERFPKVPYGQHLATCPVRAWSAWTTRLADRGRTEGAAFPRIDRHGNLGDQLSAEGVGDIVTALAAAADLGHRTAHGLRAGMATEARRAKHDAVAIAEQGGWTRNSREMLGYMQIIDSWEDNPLHGIGL